MAPSAHDSWDDETITHPTDPRSPVLSTDVEPLFDASSADIEPDGQLRGPFGTTTSHDDDPSLPWLLQLLFGLNGLTLSILMLPLMYIINTRVQIPLPYLPTYGAIAFLPYSLKPIYAYTISAAKRRNVPRHVLFMGLLTINGLILLLYTAIPPGGVIILFVVAFCRGVTDSCAELCLGLTMIDQARRLGFRNNSTDGDHVNNNRNDSGNVYDKVVSKFQAQAATSRNVGSMVGSLVTCILFVERYLASEIDGGSTQLSGGVANSLIVLAAFLQLLGAATAFLFRDEFMSLTNSRHPGSGAIGMTNFILLAQSDNGRDRDVHEQDDECVPGEHPPTEEAGLQDDEHSHPSYSSLEDHNDETGSLGGTHSDSIESLSGIRREERNQATCGNTMVNCIMVAALQTVLVIIALKGPITEWTSAFVWEVLVISLVIGVVVTALALYCNNWWQSSHRIGLFLILKNAAPSDAMIVWSFFYALFESQPLSLQVLSFLEMGVVSLSSWSYSKLWSRYHSGRPFMILMGGLAVVASLASLLNVVVFQAHHRDALSTSIQQHSVLGFAILAKFICTFTEEWAFLPEIVLATTSLSVYGQDRDNHENEEIFNANEETRQTPDHVASIPAEATVSRAMPAPDTVGCISEDRTDSNEEKIAMEYGTLVSCIDFGDQLGSLAAAPLVALLGISRENDFQGLDRLIVICAVVNITVSLAILPLLRKKT